MSVNFDHKLNSSNFFHYYLFNPLSKDLSSNDRIKALLGTICLGFTLGIGHAVCRIFFYDKKFSLENKGNSSEKTSKVTEDKFLSSNQKKAHIISKDEKSLSITPAEKNKGLSNQTQFQHLQAKQQNEDIKTEKDDGEFRLRQEKIEKSSKNLESTKQLEELQRKQNEEKEKRIAEQTKKEEKDLGKYNKEMEPLSRAERIFAKNKSKAEEFKSLSDTEKRDRCSGMNIKEIYNLQQIFYEVGEEISIFPYLSRDKLREWDFEIYNPFKEFEFTTLFPDNKIGENFTAKQMTFFFNNFSITQFGYITFYIPSETFEEFDFKLVEPQREEWQFDEFQKVIAFLYGNENMAKEKIKKLSIEQLNYVFDLLEPEDLEELGDKKFKGIDFGFLKNTWKYEMLFPLKNLIFGYKSCEDTLTDLAKRRIGLLSQEQFNALEVKSKEKSTFGSYFNEDLLKYIKETRNFVSQNS